MSKRSRHIDAYPVHYVRAAYDSAAINETDIVCEIDAAGESAGPPAMELRIRIESGPASRRGGEDRACLDLRPQDFERLRDVLTVAIDEAKRVGILPP